MGSLVTEVPAAAAHVAVRHFVETLSFETDCWDVHQSMMLPQPDFVLVDVRDPVSFSKGHVEGAINIPHRKIVESRMAGFPNDTLFVVYCGGPHCNGAHKAAIRLARQGRPVKLMIGGITGWMDEGFSLVADVT